MRLLIVGLGVIGTGYGWAFAEAGHDVTHLVRPGRAGQYEAGIPIDLLDRRPGHAETLRVTYRAAVVEALSPDLGVDLVMVPVKHYQLAGTLRGLVAVLPDAHYLLFAANWDGLEAVDALLPRSQYAWGYSSSTGGHGGAKLVFNMSADYRCGPIDDREPPWAQDVADLFAAAHVAPDRKRDMREWLWVHFAIAAGMIGAALYAGGLQQLLEDELLLCDLMVPAVRECLAVLAARGVDPAAWPDAAPYLTQPAKAIAAAAHQSIGTAWVQRTCVAGHFGENREEMSRFYLDVLETGESLGVAVPVLRSFKERIVGSA
ncbi:MAG: 2-dehydropantoate 2-reductase N-terminal domain-containing protein [Actinomycetes bacterium]